MHQDDQRMSIMRMIYHISRQHFNRIHAALSEYDVYPGQPPLMFALAHKNGQSQKELAAQLEITAATLTVMLNRMEKSGMVMRRADDKDQRVSRIYITDKGLETLRSVQETLDRLEQQAIRGLDKADLDSVSNILSHIQHNIRAMSTNPGDGHDTTQDARRPKE